MNKSVLTGVVTTCLFINTAASFATNGYWAEGYGPMSKAMAGACVAVTLEGMCNAINPATTLGLGESAEANLSVFVPDRGFNADANGYQMIPPGKYTSGNDFFLIPGLNYNHMLDADSAVGVTVGGNGGMNTHYNQAVFSKFGSASSPTGMDLMQGFVGVNYTRRLNQVNTIGIMPFLAVQSLSVYGLEPFEGSSSDPTHVTNNGTDMSYGAGARVGWMGHISEQWTLGASYQTRSWMTKFDEYSGLLAEHGAFDIPPNYDLGFAFQPNQSLILSFDFQTVQYSQIKSMANSSAMPTAPTMGLNYGMGFGWNDVHVLKFGTQWRYNDIWTFRAGYSHSDQAFGSSQALMNILAPAVVREHYTAGLSTNIDKDNELSFAINYAPEVKLYGVNSQIGNQSGYLYMDQWDFDIGWTWHL